MLKIEGCQRAWKLDDRLHVARERADSGGQNPMSQKLHLLLAEGGVLRVDGETDLTQAAKHLAKMVRARNQNVMEEGRQGGLGQERRHVFNLDTCLHFCK